MLEASGRKGVFPFLIAVLLLLGAQTLAAQGNGSIVGQVLLPTGGHISGPVLIELQFRGSTIKSDYTDDEGHFSFYELLSNPYQLVINEEEFQPIRENIIVRTEISPITRVRILLRPRSRSEPETPPPPAGVSGANPHMIDADAYLQRFPRAAVREFEAGVKDAGKGKMGNALKHYRKAIEIAPEFYPALNNMGSVYLAQQKFEEAEKAFREAIRLNDADASARFNLGNVLLLTGRYEEAEEEIASGLSRESLSSLGLYLLGSVQVRLQEYARAEQSLLRARELDPGMANIRLELVRLYLTQRRRDAAVDELSAFLKEFPHDPLYDKAKSILEALQKGDSL